MAETPSPAAGSPTFSQSIVELKSTSRTYSRRQKIFSKGDFGHESFKISHGSVGVYAVDTTHFLPREKLLATLREGETFGELALLRENFQRTATCRALEDNTELRVHRRKDQNVIEQLGPGVEVEEVAYKEGEVIVKEGEEGNSFFVITEGFVDVTVNDTTVPSCQRKVNSIAPGEIFGERAVLSKQKVRTANCIARGKVKMLRVTCQMLSIQENDSPIMDMILRHKTNAPVPASAGGGGAKAGSIFASKMKLGIFDVALKMAGKHLPDPKSPSEPESESANPPKSKWSVLKKVVVTSTKGKSKSLKNYIHEQSQRTQILKSVKVNHKTQIIKLEPVKEHRRKSTSTKLFLDEMAKFHKQGVEHARQGVDTQPPKSLVWTVNRAKLRIKDEISRVPDVKLPRTLKNHMSREQLVHFRTVQNAHKKRVKHTNSFIDDKLPKSFKPRKYKRPSSAYRRTTNALSPSAYRTRVDDEYLYRNKYHYQEWLMKNNTFYQNVDLFGKKRYACIL